jgi:hypothetical protein
MSQQRTVTDDAGIRTKLLRLGEAERRARDNHAAAKEARDAAILEADDAGWGPRPISHEVGLDASSVLHVIARETARRQAAAGE